MNVQATLQKLEQMRLYGLAAAYRQSLETNITQKYTADELIAHLAQAEWDERYNRKLKRLISNAKFRYQASFDEIDYKPSRNLDKNQLLRFQSCDWMKKHHDILVTGATGTGKSFIATALGYAACFNGNKVGYYNCSKLFERLRIAKADGTYIKEMEKILKLDLLIIDDFGLKTLDTNQRHMLLEMIEDRHGKKSIIVCSQLPVSKWFDIIGEPTIADAILDRIVHGSYRIEITGESMRKKRIKQSKSL